MISAAFHTDLQNKGEGPKVYHNFEETFVRVLDVHAPKITTALGGNQKPHAETIFIKPI